MTIDSGRIVHRVVVAAGLWIVGVGIAAAVLSPLGLWRPLLVWPLVVADAAASWVASRRVPSPELTRGTVIGLVAVALAALVWVGSTSSEQVLPRRDSASYLQSAIDLAEHHGRPIAVDIGDIGGPEVLDIDGVTLASPAFYEIGSADRIALQPQFMVTAPAVWSMGWWVGGLAGATWTAALAGALGILAVGLLASVTIGSRWGPLAAAAVAMCFPIVHTARSTYSEPLAMVTLGAGLLALVAAARHAGDDESRDSRYAAFVAGILVAGTIVVRIDGLREVVLALVVVGLAAVQRRAWAQPLAVGLGVGTLVGGAVGGALSYRYLASISASLVPLVALGVVVALASALVVRQARRGAHLPAAVTRRLPVTLAAGTLVGGLVLASRPLWLVVRQSPADPGSRVVAGLQQRQGLVVDGGRTYAEQTVTWLTWWVGPYAAAIALLALTWLVLRMARAWTHSEQLPAWSGPLVIAAGSSVLTLIRPGITPDHPWADRRLLIALALVAVLVVAAAARVALVAAEHRGLLVGGLAAVTVGAVCAIPTLAATLPHVGERVEAGEWTAVRAGCEGFTDGDVALMVDSRAANEWPQVLRGVCGVPALSTTSALRQDPAALRAAVDRIATAVAADGRRLVLVAADSTEALVSLGATDVRKVVDVVVHEDARLLERRPDALVPLPVELWTAPAPPN